MLDRVEIAKQKWSGYHKSVDIWLQERQKLLVQYCQLAGLPPFEKAKSGLPETDKIRDFCENLVDYVSTGHFEVYDKLASDPKSQNVEQNLENSIYPRISETTEEALAFNDAFAEASSDKDLVNFDDKLSFLGQQLEARFELEDHLLQSLNKQG
ncbi:Rsd/AlgQ family anti-sigma factor [Aliiglaciecola lipolytica]|uniref:Regulator of sigma D n=1 Tax=Aliiglaciecola lipolytica E3 TaxID=1127673 RepID=K6WYX0_9ALTE|nr:Rsd/AlgQ family anti-sigma factor [Aliiglaciecola lipolytica]GAC13649.1 regulator of sigma D [Aliiglaciecola lipolytica E3]